MLKKLRNFLLLQQIKNLKELKLLLILYLMMIFKIEKANDTTMLECLKKVLIDLKLQKIKKILIIILLAQKYPKNLNNYMQAGIASNKIQRQKKTKGIVQMTNSTN
jgi:hypothetical protein